MSETEQVAALSEDLHKVIERYRLEYDLCLASVIGTLEVVKLEVFAAAE